MVRTIEIMDERGNPTSEITWEIAVYYSTTWDFSERLKLAWQILRGKG
jgi:hypothetical protein